MTITCDTELRLKKIFKIVFSLDDLPADFLSLGLGDITPWDSMGNLNLLLAVEEEFGIRFTMEQMGDIRSIKAIVENISDRS